MISRTRTFGSIGVTIKPFGNWVGLDLLLKELPLLVKTGSEIGQKKAANRLRRLTRRNLKNGGVPGQPPWPDLSSQYKIIKARDGFDPNKILYRTGKYYNNIKVWKNKSRYYVGVKKGIRASGNSRKTVGWVAHLLERGSAARNIKPRPLWVPTYKQFGGSKKVKKIIIFNIAKVIYLRHQVRVKIT